MAIKDRLKGMQQVATGGAKMQQIPDDNGMTDIKKALLEIPVGTKIYYEYHKKYNNDNLKSIVKNMNDIGVLNSTLPFYATHLTNTFATTIFNNKTDKVLDGAKLGDDNVERNLFLRDFSRKLFELGKFYTFEKDDGTYILIDYYRVHETELGYTVITDKGDMIVKLQHYDFGAGYREELVDLKKESNNKKVIVSNQKLQKIPIQKVDRATNDISAIKDTLLSLSATETEMIAEVKELSNTLHADEGYFKGKNFLRKGKYRIYNNSTDVGDKEPLFKFVNEPLKDYSSVIEYLKKSLSNELGLSLVFLGIDKTNDVTATEVLANDIDSAIRINADKVEVMYWYNLVMKIYNPNAPTLELPKIVADEENKRVAFLKDTANYLDVDTRYRILFPDLKGDERTKKVIAFKRENGIPLTVDEEKLEYDSGNVPVIDNENTFEQ